MTWSRSLSRVLVTRTGVQIRTLGDARAFMIALEPRYSGRHHWQHAAGLVLDASKGEGEIERATDQIALCLLLDGLLDPVRTPLK